MEQYIILYKSDTALQGTEEIDGQFLSNALWRYNAL